MVSDPNIKKFFGPQMSEADVRLMTAAGTTLNPEAQSPAKMKEEIGRLISLFDRLKGVASQQKGGSTDKKTQSLRTKYNY